MGKEFTHGEIILLSTLGISQMGSLTDKES